MMTREEVTALAREAGISVFEDNSFADDMYICVLYRFANLVAAAEREACIDLCKNVIALEEADPKKSPRHTAWARVCAIAIRARRNDD